MIKIEDNQLVKCLDEKNKSKPSSIEEAVTFALEYNQTSISKIQVYTSVANLKFVAGIENHISEIIVKFKHWKLEKLSILSLADNGYCCNKEFFILVDDKMQLTLGKLFGDISVLDKIKPLCDLDQSKITDEDRQIILNLWSLPKVTNSDIKLTLTAYPYQELGTDWLNKCFQERQSCLLADDMGLGKTA